MRELGVTLVLFAVISGVLKLLHLGVQLLLVYWIDTWGDTTGWVIRGGMLLLGLALIAASVRKK